MASEKSKQVVPLSEAVDEIGPSAAVDEIGSPSEAVDEIVPPSEAVDDIGTPSEAVDAIGPPFDSVEEILVRLSCKDLCRFNYVCKGWSSLFREPWFRKKHKMFAAKKILIQQLNEDTGPHIIESFYEYDSNGNGALIHQERKHLLLLLHCDGLFCLRLFYHIVVVWNPSTRQRRDVTSTIEFDSYCCAIAFAFFLLFEQGIIFNTPNAGADTA